MRTEPQKWQLDTPYAEQNPIIVHNIIHNPIIISCCATRLQSIKLQIILFIVSKPILVSQCPSSTINRRVCLYRIRLRIAFLSVTHTYIYTYIQTIAEIQRRISCLALRRSANVWDVCVSVHEIRPFPNPLHSSELVWTQLRIQVWSSLVRF